MPTEGSLAPDFTAPTHDGKTLHLSDLRGHPVVLYFYPKADTPGCTVESKGFRDEYQGFRARGIEIVGVSVDSVDDQCAFADKYSLPFPLVADSSKTVAKEYGVLGPRGTARRVTFLIDPKGVISKVVDTSDAPEHVRIARRELLGA